jgi:hypothetical protein
MASKNLFIFVRLMEYLHNPTDISENWVVRHLKVSYDKK